MGYGNAVTTFNFNSIGTTLICGSNGSGKTSIIEALTFCLYDKTISAIDKDGLVNIINKKNCEVVVVFEKAGWFYQVRRARKMKAGASGNYVKLSKRLDDKFEAGDEITAGTSDATNLLIEQAVGIPFDLFIRIVVFSASHTPFLKLPVRHPAQPSQVSFIERLFSITDLSNLVDSLKDRIKNNESVVNAKIAALDQLKKQHTNHANQINTTTTKLSDWSTQQRKSTETMCADLEKAQAIDFSQENNTLESIKNWKEVLVEQTSHLHNTKRQFKIEETEIVHLSEELDHLEKAECPYCLRDYNDQMKRDEVVDKLKVKKQCNQTTKTSIVNSENDIADLQRLINETKTHFKSLEEMRIFQTKVAALEDKIHTAEQQTNPYVSILKELKEVVLEPIDYSQVNDLKKLILHEKFLQKLLSDKDSFIRKTILNKYIPFLNQRLQKYVSDFELPHSVYFTQQMEAEISQFGSVMGFNNLSNGQKARVNIALSLAFREVLQKMHGRVNICICDESIDHSLDKPGVVLVGRALKKIARDDKISMWIISHRTELQSVFDKTLNIRMENGFSLIE